MTNTERLNELKSEIGKKWQEILTDSPVATALAGELTDRRLYQIYLIETYHYTFHNARNQAIAGARLDNRNPHYMKYCFRHAQEEVGHELMALHDLKTMGVKRQPAELPSPLASTQVLIAYLYWISSHGNPIQRMGYSLWAENSYEYLKPLISRAQKQMRLENHQMSFFIEHGQIDEKHSEQVERMIGQMAQTEQDWEALSAAALTTLTLSGRMLEEIASEYGKLRSGKPSRYAFLNETDAGA